MKLYPLPLHSRCLLCSSSITVASFSSSCGILFEGQHQLLPVFGSNWEDAEERRLSRRISESPLNRPNRGNLSTENAWSKGKGKEVKGHESKGRKTTLNFDAASLFKYNFHARNELYVCRILKSFSCQQSRSPATSRLAYLTLSQCWRSEVAFFFLLLLFFLIGECWFSAWWFVPSGEQKRFRISFAFDRARSATPITLLNESRSLTFIIQQIQF